MDSRSMKLLEKAFIAEIEGAAEGGLGLMQTKSKLVDKLVEEGYLVKDKCVLGGRIRFTVEGYSLTHLGRITYCTSC